MRLSSEGSTSALAISAPPATKRTIASATSCDTRPLPGPMTASSALLARHRREAQAVLRDARHLRLQALERREVVLAQRDQHAVVAAREIEALGRQFVGLQPRLERPRRAVLDQVRQIVDEARRARAAGLVGLGQREDLLELVEDQERDERACPTRRAARRRGGAGTPTATRRRSRRPPASTRRHGARSARIVCLICSPGSGASAE